MVKKFFIKTFKFFLVQLYTNYPHSHPTQAQHGRGTMPTCGILIRWLIVLLVHVAIGIVCCAMILLFFSNLYSNSIIL